jgi:hypothetical protein
MCLINKAVVLWVKGQGKSAHESMSPPSHEIRLICEAIRFSDIDRVYMLWESVTDASWIRIAMWSRWHFNLDYQIVQNKMFPYKIYLHTFVSYQC